MEPDRSAITGQRQWVHLRRGEALGFSAEKGKIFNCDKRQRIPDRGRMDQI
jgi:hypothetical protein